MLLRPIGLLINSYSRERAANVLLLHFLSSLWPYQQCKLALHAENTRSQTNKAIKASTKGIWKTNLMNATLNFRKITKIGLILSFFVRAVLVKPCWLSSFHGIHLQYIVNNIHFKVTCIRPFMVADCSSCFDMRWSKQYTVLHDLNSRRACVVSMVELSQPFLNVWTVFSSWLSTVWWLSASYFGGLLSNPCDSQQLVGQSAFGHYVG